MKIGDAQRDAAAANLARVKLEDKLAWRTLTSAQIGELCAALKPFAGQAYGVFLHLDSPEENALSGDIASAFQCAGWEHKGGDASLSPPMYPDPFRAGLNFHGFAVDVNPSAPNRVKEAAATLTRKLSAWIAVSPKGPFGTVDDPVQGTLIADQIRIMIGRKP